MKEKKRTDANTTEEYLCTCECNQKKVGAPRMVGEPGSSAIRTVEPLSSPEETSKDDSYE